MKHFFFSPETFVLLIFPFPTRFFFVIEGRERAISENVTLFGKTRLNENSVVSVFNTFSMR